MFILVKFKRMEIKRMLIWDDSDELYTHGCTHTDNTHTHSGILRPVSSSTLYWLQQRMRERVNLGGAVWWREGRLRERKQQCIKAGRGAWGTQSKRGAIQPRREGTPDWMGPAVPWWSMGQVLGFSHCSESFFYSLCLCISLRTV